MAKESKLSRFEDRLNLLPDDILINSILPLLPMKEAARTSILARRWRFLWRYTPSLDLDAKELVAQGCYQQRNFFPGFRRKVYSTWVDQVIRSYRGSAALRLFRLQFPLHGFLGRWDKHFSGNIDSWIMFSIEKGVEVLEVSCRWETEQNGYEYSLPSIPPCLFPNLRLLKSLTLRGVPVTNESLEHFLLCCEFLERLQLHCLDSVTRVNVTGTVSRLKSIEISYTYLEAIMIYAPTPDLVSFTYPVPWVKQFHIEHAPRLVELSIGQNAKANFCLISHPLFRYLSQLEALHLSLRCWELVIHWLPNLPDLSRLKHLKLKISGFEYSQSAYHGRRVHGLASLIKAVPSVQHLTLEVLSDCEPLYIVDIRKEVFEIIRKEFANLHLQNLRVIEILWFHGRNSECALALNLITAAVSLEKLIIHCWHPIPPGPGCFNKYAYISEREIVKARTCAEEMFQPKLTSKAELVLI